MRVGTVVFANRWTGAASVAELHCRSLRAVGIDARFLFVGGDNLERRLSEADWASPGLCKERTPARVVRNVRVLRTLAADSDLVLCHLPHDHALSVVAGLPRLTRLVRAVRSPGHLRTDPYHRFLADRAAAFLPAFADLGRALGRALGGAPSLVLPVPLEERFTPVGPGDWRRRLEIPSEAPVLGMVGKLADGRGFELLLQTAARLTPTVYVVLVGHGEAQIDLEILAGRLGLGHRVRWTGYQERALPSLYGVMDVVLFAAPGSDWGHRAISEAQGCGRPVVAAELPGVEDLVDDGLTGKIATARPEAFAQIISKLLANPEARHRLGHAAASAVENRRLVPSGRRLAAFLSRAIADPAVPRTGAT